MSFIQLTGYEACILLLGDISPVYPSNQISQIKQSKCLANQIKSVLSSKQIDICRFVKSVKLYV